MWRIAFFGRLEERKGIKLFVQAVNELQKSSKIVENTEFEIYIIGPDAAIDMVGFYTSRSDPSRGRAEQNIPLVQG